MPHYRKKKGEAMKLKLFSKYVHFLYRKFIKRDCPHFCFCCAFKQKECFKDFLNGDWYFK